MKNLLLSLTFLAIASPSWGLGVTAGQTTTVKLANGSVTTPKLHLEALDGFGGAINLTPSVSLTGANPFFKVNPDAGSGTGGIQFYNNDVQKWNWRTLGTTFDLSLYNNGGTASENLTILHASGNVGIGTASPSEKLHMSSGTLRIDGLASEIKLGQQDAAGGITVSSFTMYGVNSLSDTAYAQFFMTQGDVLGGSRVSLEANRLTNNNGTQLKIYTNASGSADVPKLSMTIDPDRTTLSSFMTLGATAAAPSTCSIGDVYVDTSGAYCACGATDTWEKMNATGTCS